MTSERASGIRQRKGNVATWQKGDSITLVKYKKDSTAQCAITNPLTLSFL